MPFVARAELKRAHDLLAGEHPAMLRGGDLESCHSSCDGGVGCGADGVQAQLAAVRRLLRHADRESLDSQTAYIGLMPALRRISRRCLVAPLQQQRMVATEARPRSHPRTLARIRAKLQVVVQRACVTNTVRISAALRDSLLVGTSDMKLLHRGSVAPCQSAIYYALADT